MFLKMLPTQLKERVLYHGWDCCCAPFRLCIDACVAVHKHLRERSLERVRVHITNGRALASALGVYM